jgi:hypothetical protein
MNIICRIAAVWRQGTGFLTEITEGTEKGG